MIASAPANPTGPAAPVPATVPPAAVRRSGRTPRDMALSLLVLLIPMLLFVLTYRYLHHGDEPVVVDPAATIAQARSAGAFPVEVPEGLGTGWRTVSAVFRTAENGATLRLGYLAPSGSGLQVVQSDVPAAPLLAVELGEGPRATGTETVAGRAWQRYTARSGETALVLTEAGRTVVVIGDASIHEVRALAGSMR